MTLPQQLNATAAATWVVTSVELQLYAQIAEETEMGDEKPGGQVKSAAVPSTTVARRTSDEPIVPA